MRRDPSVNNRACFVTAGGRLQVATTHDFVDIADGKTLSVGKDHDCVGKPGYLGD